MKDRFWELLAKYWSNQISLDEKAELEQMLLDHPDHWLKMGMMEQLEWNTRRLLAEDRVEKMAENILHNGRRSRKHRNLRRRHRLWKAAVAALLIAAVGGALLFFLEKKQVGGELQWQQTVTTNGMRTMLRLADGTRLWLNAGSALRYPDNFDRKTREVYLSGEAYFDVVHDAGRPFIIHTDGMEVKVLGTEVDVRAYKEEQYAVATLIRGAVEVMVRRQDDIKRVLLKPNQKVEVYKPAVVPGAAGKPAEKHRIQTGTGVVPEAIVVAPVVMKDSLISETAWRENTLLFDDETLQSLAMRLERWYGVTISINDSTLALERFTGRADNIPVEKLLDILQLLKPFHYTIRDKRIVIRK